jgi:hypothetical protein
MLTTALMLRETTQVYEAKACIFCAARYRLRCVQKRPQLNNWRAAHIMLRAAGR